ncbi:MAG: 50S ribosomal protein L10 [Acidobacteria bacterium]|jgi:large subunit ribosomal protein L10|nr:50S ribosomal protein L10 [Acidobacteriota bacterium]
MNRTEKQELVEKLHEELEAAPHVVLVDFRGLSVPAATEFRRKVKAADSTYRVVKNRLALRAAKGTSLEKLESEFEGTTGIAWTGEDPVALAKVLVDFAKDYPALELKAGIVAGDQVLDAEGVKALSAMPSLPELRASFLGLLQAPATKLVRLLQAPGTQMAQVLRAHQEEIERE